MNCTRCNGLSYPNADADPACMICGFVEYGQARLDAMERVVNDTRRRRANPRTPTRDVI